MTLVLSCFPGIGMLDHAFECEGFTVVRGPDPLWGGDIRRFHPPPGRFDGIIGGDPCQSHSALANLVRAKGLEPSFPDLSPEYERVVNEAQPLWFLRENVPQAPDIKPEGYTIRSFLLDNSTLDSGDGTGNEQMRRRRFWFGVRGDDCPELRRWIDFCLFELPDSVQAVAGDAPSVPVAIGGSGRRKVTAVGGHDGTADAIDGYRKARAAHAAKAAPLPGRHEGRVGSAEMDYSPPRRSLTEILRLQGYPPDFFGEIDESKGVPKHSPFRVDAMRKMVGNGVPRWMGSALAKAIRCWLDERAKAVA